MPLDPSCGYVGVSEFLYSIQNSLTHVSLEALNCSFEATAVICSSSPVILLVVIHTKTFATVVYQLKDELPRRFACLAIQVFLSLSHRSSLGVETRYQVLEHAYRYRRLTDISLA